MDPILKEKLLHRLQSFAWRVGGMIVVASLAFLANPENLKLLGAAPAVIVLIGLIVNELTKFINSNLPEIRKPLETADTQPSA